MMKKSNKCSLRIGILVNRVCAFKKAVQYRRRWFVQSRRAGSLPTA